MSATSRSHEAPRERLGVSSHDNHIIRQEGGGDDKWGKIYCKYKCQMRRPTGRRGEGGKK